MSRAGFHGCWVPILQHPGHGHTDVDGLTEEIIAQQSRSHPQRQQVHRSWRVSGRRFGVAIHQCSQVSWRIAAEGKANDK
jgi:hypothetical protein